MNDRLPVAVVSGAAHGIGWAISRRLAEEGHEIVLLDRDEAALEARWQALRATGHAARVCQVDLSDRAQVLALARRLSEPLQRVRVLVNNAGISPKRNGARIGFAAVALELDWRPAVETNLTAALILSELVIPAMKSHGRGRIINIGSRVGRSPTGTSALASMPYLVTKTAMQGMTRAVARQLAPHGITVNGIAPGRIQTAMGSNVQPALHAAILADIPVGRWGAPADVAHVAAFLASEHAGFITGATVDVNGGALML
ncbi:short-chain dehydrogenase [Bordetella pertussis]|uniref:3-oxoacyl-[acyl-carrier-protein] reductase FabG n=3 Tax=Bordetella pertussis TaxID=520 RepID=A0A0E7UA54_BORPT|nr:MULTISPECIES: SDR family NAD(P)-dependent oxidoreductase [Bordetella]ETH38624.1 NAD(P)H-binding protein, PF13460 family [Bordetella pertussis H918]ETH45697.1 NAD(P)H-binding protein, PF13460 family [Bordetella pertussis H921]ETH70015.1 NAD(P)H-binding protein, PF13460 family [Bordetella pertussis STO1-CHLA-0011]ETH83125.1 NAD(P)H-binding protein, PF13460 family [Bordetella pertussis STO1-CHOC-0017]ETH87675.1 NAD(P)H-binding protein, PF13460 family [Bordetella pertussis STO1-CHOC-0018]ETH92